MIGYKWYCLYSLYRLTPIYIYCFPSFRHHIDFKWNLNPRPFIFYASLIQIFISVQFALFAYIHFYHSCFWQLYRFTQQYISFAHLILIGCWIIYWHFAECTWGNVMTVWTLFHKSGNVKIVKIMQKSQKLFDARGYNVTTVWTLFH